MGRAGAYWPRGITQRWGKKEQNLSMSYINPDFFYLTQ